MPLELLPKSQLPKPLKVINESVIRPVDNQTTAPVNSEQEQQEVNTFNAMLGRKFLCNVCNEHHELSPRAIVSCFRKISLYSQQLNITGIKPFYIEAENSLYRSRRIESVGSIRYSINNQQFHPALFALEREDDFYKNYRVEITTDIKWIKEMSKILANKNLKDAFGNFLTNTQHCQVMISKIKSTIEKIKNSGYDMNKIGLEITSEEYKDYKYKFYNTILDSSVMPYYYKMANFNRFYTEYSRIKLSGKDLYLLLPSDNLAMFFRISLEYNFIPKFGEWREIKKAINDCPETTWQSFGKIEYD